MADENLVRLLVYFYFQALENCFRYFSPYPITEAESDELSMAMGAPRKAAVPDQAGAEGSAPPEAGKPSKKVAGQRNLHRTTLRSHGRTADMLAGGLNRDLIRENGQPNILWVCERCFKYMNEGIPYEIHKVKPVCSFTISSF